MKTATKIKTSHSKNGNSVMISNGAEKNGGSTGLDQNRLIALSAGSLQHSISEKIYKIVTDKKKNFNAIAKEGTAKLLKDNLISRKDLQNLNLIIGLVSDRSTGSRVNAEKIKRIYSAMTLDNESSPVALAIAGLTVNPERTSLPGDKIANRAVARLSRSAAADTGMVAGALTGAVIGGAIGGFGGAVIGSVIGGIVGGAVGLCTGD